MQEDAAGKAAGLTSNGLLQPKQDQGDRGRRCLYKKDPAADGRGAVNTGHDHAEQKECLDLKREGRDGMNQPPDQAGGQKAV
jgi:hypothetical protein